MPLGKLAALYYAMAVGLAALWIADRTDAPAKYVVVALGLAGLFALYRWAKGR